MTDNTNYTEPSNKDDPNEDDEDYDNEDDIVKTIHENIKESRNAMNLWRKEAKEDYDFFASRQLSEQDLAILQKEERPYICFNRIPRTLNAVMGLEVDNRNTVTYYPRKLDSSAYSELLSGTVKWVRDLCDAEDEESEMFLDMLIGGIGWCETRLSYETNSDGEIIEERIDPFEMFVDPNSKKKNFDDARWIARAKDLTKKEFNALWPDFANMIQPTAYSPELDLEMETTPIIAPVLYSVGPNVTQSNKKMIRVYQCQWYDKEAAYKTVDEQGNEKELDEDTYQRAKAVLGDKFQAVKFEKRVYKQAFIAGNKLLEQMDCPVNAFTFRAITAFRDRNKNRWFGLVSLMKDPQRWANKWLSQVMHILNTSAKSGLIAEEGAISNIRDFETNYNRPGSISYVNNLAGIQPKITTPYPDGIDRLLNYAVQAIQDVPGISLELMGVATGAQAVSVENSRKKQGVAILSPLFDAFRRFHKEQGRILAEFVIHYISDGRLVKIVGNEGAQYVPLLRQNVDFEYDVVVDESPTSSNMKEKTFAVLTSLLPTLLQANIPVPPEIVEYAPLPASLIDKWKQVLQPQPPDPMEQQKKQLELMSLQLGVEGQSVANQLTQAKTQQAMADATKQAALAEVDREMATHDLSLKAQIADVELQQAREKMMNESNRKDIEMILNLRRKNAESQAKQDMAEDEAE